MPGVGNIELTSSGGMSSEGNVAPAPAFTVPVFHPPAILPIPIQQSAAADEIGASEGPKQSEASKIVGILFTLGIAAAGIFVKNANHVQTAGNITNLLQALLPGLEAIL